jgi:hypothetical protein
MTVDKSLVDSKYRNTGPLDVGGGVPPTPAGSYIESTTANLLARGPRGLKGDKGDDGGPNVVSVEYGDTWPPSSPLPNVLYLRLAP